MPVRLANSNNHLHVMARIALVVAIGDWLTKAVAARVVATDAVVLTERLRLAVVHNDGTAFGLWSSADAGQTWRGVVLPGAAPAGSDRSAAIAGAGDLLVLVVDDGQTGKVWSTKIAPG